MKSFLILLLSVSLLGLDISELRITYPKASSNVEIANELYDQLSSISLSDHPKLIAYKGGVLSLKAKNSKTIKDKKMYFQESVQFLEAAVKNAPKDIEIRYVRLTVQEHAPKILKYNKNIDEDKSFILEYYGTIKDTQLKACILSYVKNSSLFSDEEKLPF